jgi:hypothetical protein
MLRTLFVALALIWWASLVEAEVLTLSCDGTLNGKQEAIKKMGLAVDLEAKTVIGFAVDANFDEVDVVAVRFKGNNYEYPEYNYSISGTLDRITGWLSATVTVVDKKTYKVVGTENWELICKSTKPLF